MGSRLSTLSYERDIIELLKNHNASQQAIADKLGINYYTVRRIVKGLVERGMVKVDDYVDRAAVYAYVGDEESGDYIPRVTDIVNRVSVKASYLLDAVGNEESMKSVTAAKNLPMRITELLLLAQHAQNGAVLGDKLDRLRDEITRDFLYLKNAANMFQQILEEPRFWDAKFLQQMPDDADYNYAVIQNAWDYYNDKE